MVTFVSGIQDYVATKIFNLGADVFIISKMSPVETNVEHFLVAEKRKNLKLEDYQAVLEACHHCEYVGAMAARQRKGEVQRTVDQRYDHAGNHAVDGVRFSTRT